MSRSEKITLALISLIIPAIVLLPLASYKLGHDAGFEQGRELDTEEKKQVAKDRAIRGCEFTAQQMRRSSRVAQKDLTECQQKYVDMVEVFDKCQRDLMVCYGD